MDRTTLIEHLRQRLEYWQREATNRAVRRKYQILAAARADEIRALLSVMQEKEGE